MIYFTNNTPDDKSIFPLELFTADQKKRLMAAAPDGQGNFQLTNLRQGTYILKLTNKSLRCVLLYRVNLTKKLNQKARILMDVDCAHQNNVISPLPIN